MRRLLLTFFIFFYLQHLILACYNVKRVGLNGEVNEMFIGIPGEKYYDIQKNKASYERNLIRLDSIWKIDKNYDAYTQYGITLSYLGKYEQALDVFKQIEQERSGEYTTAANMGTTYELLGDNKNAYTWISKALQINPASHDSTEWLHLKILEVKLKGDKYINSSYLLGVDFGKELIPKAKVSKDKLVKLKNALYYQLGERMIFIRPKDKIMALLFFELGNIQSIVEDVTMAYNSYKLASDYGYTDPIFEERYEYVYQLNKKVHTQLKKGDFIIHPAESSRYDTIPYEDATQNEIGEDTSSKETDNNTLFISIGGAALFLLLGIFVWKRSGK